MPDFPFRCSNCRKLSYTKSALATPPECCKGHSMEMLVSICLLVPAKPGQTPIHTTTRSTGEKAGLVNHETKWVLGCGRETLPPNFTDYPPSCTCKGCREYVEKIYEEAGVPLSLQEDLQDPGFSIQFEDSEDNPPNPFQ